MSLRSSYCEFCIGLGYPFCSQMTLDYWIELGGQITYTSSLDEENEVTRSEATSPINDDGGWSDCDECNHYLFSWLHHQLTCVVASEGLKGNPSSSGDP